MTLNFLFGMSQRVSRLHYAKWGVSLMAIKYVGEVGLYYLAKGDFLTPLNFLSPLIHSRYPQYSLLPDWFAPTVVLWSLPFIWIGAGMSLRRSADAGYSPWFGILFFVPVINFILMGVLSFAKTSGDSFWGLENTKQVASKVMSPIFLSIGFGFIGAIISWYSTNFLKIYASSLFVGSPLILGLVQAYFLNYKTPQTFIKTVSYVSVSILMIYLLLLILALEGIICLAMALPISLVLGAFGAVFGRGIAQYGKPNSFSPVILMFALPLMPVIESQVVTPHQDVVLSTIEIDAPASQVWPNVVKFSDLPVTNDWLFKLGVAHPLRARIEGEGVGAIRHCEFTTGAFVEPITVWDEPHRLAFDVRFQPQPMKELSFYDNVDAPHLDGYFRSLRGEFRLVPSSDGKKILLEGRTWYEVDMQPGWYWQLYGRWFIHRIHLRVLDHIKNLSEAKETV